MKKRMLIVSLLFVLFLFCTCSGGEVFDYDITREFVPWEEGKYNFLTIGNSMTLHGKCSYWFDGDRGMAASTDETDYFHLVTDYLESLYGDVVANPIGFTQWEINPDNRSEQFVHIDGYLDPVIDLVIIEIGENAKDISTFESDYVQLIRHIQEECPDARILCMGDYCSNGNRDEQKEQAAAACGVEYVSLGDIKDNEEYHIGLGTIVYDDHGIPRIITNKGVAFHPGDYWMRAIADKVIAALGSE